VPIVGLGICVWLATHATARDWQTISWLLALGFLLYFAERRLLRGTT
jgi:hypothetical protein